ncbi:MAG: metallophosphoesterase [Oscillatoriaceae bacterium SKW80]|nr:metallophosphoesterase [Oscillatoriaceae bacterium SKYG93]MCX8121764.1 metallophosphoesterase [Oscillatoriaceae bacterium SKW80]MDW8453619.1 metallophosphoesterase [Oscillatoriaceae cyanobacterium SKYGB_i_bin93]HIK28684.1 serine/threonine protein phosphatase [Oscillatoriaceae cyanobacterium M7585_C2015_266]
MSTISRRIFIGDVHGYYDGLMILLEASAPNSDDHIYFLGDLIDRGPESAKVVEFVQQSSYSCLLGNHEQMLLDAFSKKPENNSALATWLYSGGRSTLASYGDDNEKLLKHLNWIQTLPTHLDLGDIWLVHAGVAPKLPIYKQSREQFCWVRHQFHSITKPYFPDKLIVTGHTITFTLPGVLPGELAQGPGWLDIDTGVYHPLSGWLTGVDITNRQVYQVNVFQRITRILPLDEVVISIEPKLVLAR